MATKTQSIVVKLDHGIAVMTAYVQHRPLSASRMLNPRDSIYGPMVLLTINETVITLSAEDAKDIALALQEVAGDAEALMKKNSRETVVHTDGA